jgi:hypothetical protein
MKIISSRLTFLIKIIFPTVLITAFGVVTLSVCFDFMLDTNGVPLPPEEKWQFIFAWIIGTMFTLWCCAGLKKVRVDSTHLYVSNFRKEIAVPFSNIEDITEYCWSNNPITIHFHTPIAFGQSIRFIPTERFIPFLWASHPVVEDLKKLVGLTDR